MIYFTRDINLTDWNFNVGFGTGTNIAKWILDPLMFLGKTNKDIWIGNFEGVASFVSDNNGIYTKVSRVDPIALSSICHMDYYWLADNTSYKTILR